VIRDAYLVCALTGIDSLNPHVSYYVGEATDDYQIKYGLDWSII